MLDERALIYHIPTDMSMIQLPNLLNTNSSIDQIHALYSQIPHWNTQHVTPQYSPTLSESNNEMDIHRLLTGTNRSRVHYAPQHLQSMPILTIHPNTNPQPIDINSVNSRTRRSRRIQSRLKITTLH